jgi:hypothetical protein
MKIFKIIIISILAIVVLFFSISYIPVVFITKEGQKCINNFNCSRLKPICDEMNSDLPENSLGLKEPMCINNECACEWYGNLLSL